MSENGKESVRKMTEYQNIRKQVRKCQKNHQVQKCRKTGTKITEKWLSTRMSENGYENVSKFFDVTLSLCRGIMWFGYVTIF